MIGVKKVLFGVEISYSVMAGCEDTAGDNKGRWQSTAMAFVSKNQYSSKGLHQKQKAPPF